MISQCGAGAWLNGLANRDQASADLWEAVAHLRGVCDDVLYKSTATLLYLLLCACHGPIKNEMSLVVCDGVMCTGRGRLQDAR